MKFALVLMLVAAAWLHGRYGGSSLAPAALPGQLEQEQHVDRPVASSTPSAAASEPELAAPGIAGEARPGEREFDEPQEPSELAFSWRVVDGSGRPVSNAQVQVRGLRVVQMPGAFLIWRLDVGATDAEGRASAMLPVRHGVNDLSAVSFRVDHPDFVPWLSTGHPIDPPHAEVELERGAVLSVCGWIGQPSAEVREIDVTLDRRARLGPEDWARTGDGYLSTVRLGPGPYVLRLHHVGADGGHWYSAAEPFELERGESRHLALELLPAASLDVVLDDAVPRPVADGLARIAVYQGDASNRRPMLHQRFDTEIAADGTLRFDALPAGRAQLIAMCRGWAVECVPTADPAHLGLPALDRPEWERQQRVRDASGFPSEHSTYEAAMEARLEQTVRSDPDRARILPLLELAPGVNRLRLAMQRTADVTVRVVDTEGAPIAGAMVSQGGEVWWSAERSGGMLRPLERFITGPGGQVTVLDVPPWDSQLNARCEGYVSVGEDGRVGSSVSVRLTPEPGVTELRTLVLTPAELAGR